MDSLKYLTAGCWLENLGTSQGLSSSSRLDWASLYGILRALFQEDEGESYKMS